MELKKAWSKICLFLDVDLPKQRNSMKACEVQCCCLPVHLSPFQKLFCIATVLAQLLRIKYIEARKSSKSSLEWFNLWIFQPPVLKIRTQISGRVPVCEKLHSYWSVSEICVLIDRSPKVMFNRSFYKALCFIDRSPKGFALTYRSPNCFAVTDRPKLALTDRSPNCFALTDRSPKRDRAVGRRNVLLLLIGLRVVLLLLTSLRNGLLLVGLRNVSLLLIGLRNGLLLVGLRNVDFNLYLTLDVGQSPQKSDSKCDVPLAGSYWARNRYRQYSIFPALFFYTVTYFIIEFSWYFALYFCSALVLLVGKIRASFRTILYCEIFVA
jgi:hypothetical protein